MFTNLLVFESEMREEMVIVGGCVPSKVGLIRA